MCFSVLFSASALGTSALHLALIWNTVTEFLDFCELSAQFGVVAMEMGYCGIDDIDE